MASRRISGTSFLSSRRRRSKLPPTTSKSAAASCSPMSWDSAKPLMATALARVLADELMLETLVLCPLNLVKMWEDYCHSYRLPSCKVMSYSKVLQQLPDLRRYRLIILDESHNLRNREGKTYRVILEYIQKNDSKCILLSATPYNKDYLDLASQLRLFVPPDKELGIGPERKFQEVDRALFRGKFQCGANTLAAFEKSQYPDDWRDLMRLYMVRRTRGFIKANYAKTDLDNGRKYLEFKDGSRSYFPDRLPKKLPFVVDENDPNDEYAKLYSAPVVDIVNGLSLPRYGLGNSVLAKPPITATKGDEAILANLSAAGTRLMGFCRSNLFKRLESSGHSFLLSVERHILRNFIFIHAIENGLDIPIGTQDSGLLDTTSSDEDSVTTETFDEMTRLPYSFAHGQRVSSPRRRDIRALCRPLPYPDSTGFVQGSSGHNSVAIFLPMPMR